MAQKAFKKAANRPVPANLFGHYTELAEYNWTVYIENLPFSQQMQKFGEAVDQYCTLAEKRADPCTLPEVEQKRLCSKWNAARIAGSLLTYRLPGLADVAPATLYDFGINRLIRHLEEARSPEARVWRARMDRINALPGQKIARFISRAYGRKKFTPTTGPRTIP
jgi:hypothetical protein